jgi:hypothetical protein
MKLIIILFSPFSCHFIPFNPSHLPQSHIRKHSCIWFSVNVRNGKILIKLGIYIINLGIYILNSRVDAFCWWTMLQDGRSSFRFPMVSLEFCIDIILPTAICPLVWLSFWHK